MTYAYDLVNKTHYESKELAVYPFTWRDHKMVFASAFLEVEYTAEDILTLKLELEINGSVDLAQAAPLLESFELDSAQLKAQFAVPETSGTLYLQSQTAPALIPEKKRVLDHFLASHSTIALDDFVITKWEAGVPLG